MIPLLLLLLEGCFFFGESIGDTVPVVDFVDLEQYAGKWYEISSLPTWFAKDLVCVTATYTLLENGMYLYLFTNGFFWQEMPLVFYKAKGYTEQRDVFLDFEDKSPSIHKFL